MTEKNLLQFEKSPYLLQHATNPVNWYPWCEEAFQRAEREHKPVFLSIGYSTCHWCHVMEKESFCDEEVADYLNRYFIAIKVDREERPDLDQIYMKACQALTGQGGWPLSIFLTPDKKPFYAGTYFPRESRFGRIGFLDLLHHIHQIWETRISEVRELSENLTRHLQVKAFPREEFSGESLKKFMELAAEQLEEAYDEEFGGFGSAPKFPSPHQLLFLMDLDHFSNSSRFRDKVIHTLLMMAAGGMHDHVGGGFHRYSTDRRWLIPHFEKMLYDQAMLLLAYSQAAAIYRIPFFQMIAVRIVHYLFSDMMKDQLFCSAEDADSEGEEGKFYLFTRAEVKQLLDEEEFEWFITLCPMEETGNFADPLHGTGSGRNIIHLNTKSGYLSKYHINNLHELYRKWLIIMEKLKSARSRRIRPLRDDKILTDWNAMIIGALARAGRLLNKPAWIRQAEKSLKKLQEIMWKNGRLYHRFREGEVAVPAFLDDYAFLLWAQLELYRATLNPIWLHSAQKLEHQIRSLFHDEKIGVYFFSSADNNELIRHIELYDGAIPSGNSMMLSNLLSLFHFTGNPMYDSLAEKMVPAWMHTMRDYPAGCTMALTGALLMMFPSRELIIASDHLQTNYLKKLRSIYDPSLFIVWVDKLNHEILTEIFDHNSYKMINNEITFYLCSNFTCDEPTNDFNLIFSKLLRD